MAIILKTIKVQMNFFVHFLYIKEGHNFNLSILCFINRRTRDDALEIYR